MEDAELDGVEGSLEVIEDMAESVGEEEAEEDVGRAEEEGI